MQSNDGCYLPSQFLIFIQSIALAQQVQSVKIHSIFNQYSVIKINNDDASRGTTFGKSKFANVIGWNVIAKLLTTENKSSANGFLSTQLELHTSIQHSQLYSPDSVVYKCKLPRIKKQLIEQEAIHRLAYMFIPSKSLFVLILKSKATCKLTVIGHEQECLKVHYVEMRSHAQTIEVPLEI